jgi:hypothetical protein
MQNCKQQSSSKPRSFSEWAHQGTGTLLQLGRACWYTLKHSALHKQGAFKFIEALHSIMQAQQEHVDLGSSIMA